MELIHYKHPRLATNYSPFDFDRMASFRDLLDSAFRLATRRGIGGEAEGGVSEWAPVLDILDEPTRLVVEVEVAGMKKEDFDLSLKEDLLTISGERKYEEEERKGESFRCERFFGSFSRTVKLPAPVRADQIEARYRDGVLTVILPKADSARSKQIEVK